MSQAEMMTSPWTLDPAVMLDYLSLLNASSLSLSSPSPSVQSRSSTPSQASTVLDPNSPTHSSTDDEYHNSTVHNHPRPSRHAAQPKKQPTNPQRKRGRPRMIDQTTGEVDDAATKERRKIQIRVAQRAYRSRQQERTALLTRQVHELEQKLLIARNIYLNTHATAVMGCVDPTGPGGSSTDGGGYSRVLQENLRLLLAITEVGGAADGKDATGSEGEGEEDECGGGRQFEPLDGMRVRARARAPYPLYPGYGNGLLPSTPEGLLPGGMFEDPFDVDL